MDRWSILSPCLSLSLTRPQSPFSYRFIRIHLMACVRWIISIFTQSLAKNMIFKIWYQLPVFCCCWTFFHSHILGLVLKNWRFFLLHSDYSIWYETFWNNVHLFKPGSINIVDIFRVVPCVCRTSSVARNCDLWTWNVMNVMCENWKK